ncbi:ParB-like nuclease [Novosphingobium aromaticivorans DSM 12444]|uniref:ParB-like nuclease n=1 Tax=Novosphingobium aromaticivorans (strain ATCC 700278 / DSM 12444 / CCUG 56034 / CIP 105152 / NBRC 16084 / F199) TaxID=279238 RepID=Q2GAQ1_NOVAD|nr:ParB/RepB/Spo0J family partition protein [Novosphingobium aromaticivorans]ABD25072.1 ParB-like nuclease [Novosphingobium aromaticivorans DSM 12444]SCY96179.1 chromosome partitioning protein, ParB family [Novosphingobium aromaticivorans]
MSITTLPLSSLILSKLNVRHTERDADIAALADDIAARGLKQNLVVIPAHFLTGEAEADWDSKWEVIAGGRRFQAMQLLVADGRLPADHEVPCLLEDRDDASETSLSENLHKVAMNPADEFGAFKAIVDQRMSPKHGESEATAIAYTAKRFGKTVSYVEGRMRLADLCPDVLEALRTDKIGLEAAKAYAATTDHALQLKVFKEREKDTWNGHKPSTIRDAIRNRTLPLDHALVEFVGLVTYQAEGGRIEGEMFMGAEGQQRVVDVTLLESLARKIAEAAIPALIKEHGFKEGLYAPGQGIGYYAKWPKAPSGYMKNWGDVEGLSKAKRKQLVGVYALDKDREDGVTKVSLIGTYKPEEKQAPREERDWEAERAASQRAYQVGILAARLAVPQLTGGLLKDTELDGRTFWPKYSPRLVDEDPDDENFKLVAMMIRVPVADIEANRAEAERLYDEELAAEEAARAAPQSQDDDEDDGADELVTDEAEG